MMTIDDLATATTAELVQHYEELHGKPPRVKHAAWLRKRVAWKIQERRYGGLSVVAKRKLEELIAELDLPFEDGSAARPKSDPPPGTVLVRRWKGQDITVTVMENGVEWSGTVYRSLSAVARAVTGSRWNGRLFFGLTPRRKAR